MLKIAAPDGLVGPAQLPRDAEVGEEDDEAGEEGAEHGQGHDEGGAVQGLPVAAPVYGAGQSEGLRAVAAPAQQGKQGPQAGVQPDRADHHADGFPLEPETWRTNNNLRVGWLSCTAALWLRPAACRTVCLLLNGAFAGRKML